MVELTRLINLLEKRATKSSGKYIDLPESGLEAELYQLIKAKKVKSDKEAETELYGHQGDAKGYKMLKSRLKKKLFAAVDHIDLRDPCLKPFAHDEQQCLVLINRAHVLMRVGEHHLVLKLIQQAIGIGKSLNMASLLVRCYEIAYRASSDIKDESLFRKYQAELKVYRRVLALEEEAEELYRDATFDIFKFYHSRKNKFEQLPSLIQLLEEQWKASGSPQIFSYWQFLINFYNERIGNYECIITNTHVVESMVIRGEIPEKQVDLRYYKFVKLYALLQLRRYEEGLAYAALVEPAFIIGTNNWATFMENYFLVALHSKEYTLAHQLINKLLTSGVVDVLNPLAKERWTLNVRFYNLVAAIEDNGLPLISTGQVELLRISHSDKEGFNVAIIILEFFNLLQQDGEVDPTSHADRIRKYIAKHLNKKETERPKLFLKLVLLMLREKLHPAACRTKGRYLYQKLKATSLPASAFAEVEIIPYEHLWELALLKLKQRKHIATQNAS